MFPYSLWPARTDDRRFLGFGSPGGRALALKRLCFVIRYAFATEACSCRLTATSCPPASAHVARTQHAPTLTLPFTRSLTHPLAAQPVWPPPRFSGSRSIPSSPPPTSVSGRIPGPADASF